MKSSNSTYKNLKPSWTDWLWAGISLIFLILGIFTLPQNRNLGILLVVLFGLCAWASVSIVRRKLRESRFQSLSVSVVGGVEIRPSRVRTFVVGVSMILLGGVFLFFEVGLPLPIHVIPYLFGGAGIVLVALTAFKIVPIGSIRFDPEGFRIARRKWTIFIPWDEIAEIGTGEYQGSAAVFFGVKSLAPIRVEPVEFRPKVIREILWSEEWLGVQFMILNEDYGISSPLLAEALERYRLGVEFREELKKRSIE